MDVITTHVNADFDCLGAMVAAKRLYPDALMVFSGSQEKSMRDFFLKSPSYVPPFTRLKDVDFEQITRLILVDCQHSSRVGRFAEVAGRPGVEVHIYDHHPGASGDIRPSGGEIRDCGASTSILAKILRERGTEVTPVEATLMMLGIYEDTGNLTFPSTTTDDYAAASWLLERGANLNVVADFVTQELTAQQVSLLNDLIKSLQTVCVNGVDVAIAHAALEYYVGDIAVLAHMMRDMENLEALFVVVAMGDRVYLVARSRIPEVDVGAILREMGGGGHATAAAATVRGETVIQVVERLQRLLPERVNPKRTAADLMSSPVMTMPVGTTLAEAREYLTRYNVNAMPVMDGERMTGIISRRIVEKALYHGLGDLPASEYMHTEYLCAEPSTPIAALQEYIVVQHRRLVPVFEKERLVGVITRTDLLRYMYAGLQRTAEAVYDLARDNLPVRRREVLHLMNKSLPARVVSLLRDLGRVGDELELPVYAVGGFVRDLLLGNENDDIDVSVEGDGILFAETFAARMGYRVKSHEKFGTAVIVFPDGFKVDVASTRLEYYATPGALPTVERSSLKMDLYRRDFTINTLAIRLSGADFGMLFDYFGAYRDLQEKSIRVLHNLSFVEDPTRVFRAIRFEQRLGFQISRHTENLVKNAVKMGFLDKLGGKRLLNELVAIMKEREPVRAILRMSGLGLLRFIHPEIVLQAENLRVLDEVKKVTTWFDLLYLAETVEVWVVYFLALTTAISDDSFWGACTRLSVSEHYRERLIEMRIHGEQVLEVMERKVARGEDVRPSDIYFWLRGLTTEVLLYIMAKTRRDEVRKFVSLFVTRLRGVTTSITGDDLKRLGLPAGPRYREILDRILTARLNGEAASRDDELRIASGEIAAV
ncbi:A-adding tRNA nucleotidyltransferase [Geobacter pickeringii]|uniref:Polya polymerase n=1 Tax=Geobacter pickeringii TaxID=345632 RepID=A0A0B5BDP4_9BACT|nr:A-adding tRNA nucleotidyltransferase [Geobacter pickeringii]AJE03269.1 polya polymerase [Geobacter pickeringii]